MNPTIGRIVHVRVWGAVVPDAGDEHGVDVASTDAVAVAGADVRGGDTAILRDALGVGMVEGVVPLGDQRQGGRGSPHVRLAGPGMTPTQVRRPWRATLRTAFAALVALAAMAPVLVDAAGLDPSRLPWLAGVLAVCAAVTRVLALPGVEAWLRRFVPWLAADADPPIDITKRLP